MPGNAELGQAVAHFRDHGWVLLPGYLSEDEVARAQAELGTMFPTPEDFRSGLDPAARAALSSSQFAGIQPFPYRSAAWSLLGVAPAVVALAEAILGTPSIRLYEAHNWAKYAGAVDYEQALHSDYGNHILTVPRRGGSPTHVEMFLYVHDVPEGCGPTKVVSRQDAAHVPDFPPQIPFGERPEVYEREVSASGPAGTVLAYGIDTWHRGTQILDPDGSRFVVKASYRVADETWSDALDLVHRLGADWYAFVNEATARQLEVVGFPPRGDQYWTDDTWARCCARYPDADLSAFRPS